MTGRRHVIVDHSPELAWRLADGSNPDAGTIVVGVTPDLRRRHELGQDILVSLGKRTDVSGVGRRADEDWEVLPAWLEAHRITNIVVTRTETLPLALWDDIIDLAAGAEACLWFVAYRPAGDKYHQALTKHGFGDAHIDDVLAIAPPAPETTPAPEPWFPAVPADPYLTFLATARDRLDPDAFAAVRSRYVDAAAAMTAWLEEADAIDETTVIAALRDLLRPCVSYDEMLTVLRASQAAGHNAGWLISIDPMRFCATAESAPAATIADGRTWARLAAYRDPYRACACALAALEWSVDEICAVTVADIAEDGSTVTRPDQAPARVPAGSEVYLRAQAAYRRRQGAGGDAPLFAAGDRPLTDRTIVEAVRAPAGDLGINLLSGPFSRRTFDDRMWTRRWGVSVQEVA